jgi:outer membrane protein OmpA-like peptidoglycan-associated protein
MNARGSRPRNWEEYRELRRLLLEGEMQELEALKDQPRIMDPTPEQVSDVLPDAIVHRSKLDSQLSAALTPIVEDSFDSAIKRDPQRIVDVIFPVMGPAIRKSIAETLRGMIQSLNAALEHSLSAKGLKWRVEAMRSGKPFAEVAMSHSLIFRIEQVFLIHRESGLLLEHVALPLVDTSDGDMVSGMLTAIQDFVYDSFSPENGGTLGMVEVGEYTVWVEQGTRAVLAAVIRGEVPTDQRRVLTEAVESIHLEMRRELADYEGDSSPFERIKPIMQECLVSRTDEDRPDKKRSYLFVWIFLAVLLISGGIWTLPKLEGAVRWSDFVDRLEQEPGIMVTETGRSKGLFVISGLRDPLSTNPDSIANEMGLDTSDVGYDWKLYQSLEEPFVVKRAAMILNPPDGVIFSMEHGNLVPIGVARHTWITEAQYLARSIPGIRALNAHRLTDITVDSLRKEIEVRQIYFDLGRSRIGRTQQPAINKLVALMNELHTLTQEINMVAFIEIVGQADASGSDETNLRLSQQRANQVQASLITSGLDQDLLSASGVGAASAADDESVTGANSRRVTFDISFMNRNTYEDTAR